MKNVGWLTETMLIGSCSIPERMNLHSFMMPTQIYQRRTL